MVFSDVFTRHGEAAPASLSWLNGMCQTSVAVRTLSRRQESHQRGPEAGVMVDEQRTFTEPQATARLRSYERSPQAARDTVCQ